MRERAPHAGPAGPSWVIHIKQQLDIPMADDLVESMPSIKRVPAPLHSVRPSAFTPQTLAIGAFHRNLIKQGDYAFSFAEMEELKLMAAKALSAQSSAAAPAGGLIPSMVQEVRKQEKDVRAYFGSDMGLEELCSDELCYMLALDCVFIVAMMHCLYNELQTRNADDAKRWWAPSSFMQVYETRFAPPLKKAAMLDLLLLENQVPLFLVKKVMQMIDGVDDVEVSWQALVDVVAYRALPFCKGVRGVGARNAKHLLDCLYSVVTCNVDNDDCQKLGDALLQRDLLRQGRFCVVPTASQLRQAGVKFNGHSLSLSHVSFHRHTLNLPIIHVGNETERIFRNLLAHESQLSGGRADLVSYLHFMNSLINTAEDVAVLVEAGVISESIGDHHQVARLWNELATNTVCIFTPRYMHVGALANAYLEKEIHSVMTELRERYFSRPWLLLSVFSGTALLVMTFVIMWYTIEIYIKG